MRGRRAYWCLVKVAIHSSGSANKRCRTYLIHGHLTVGYSAVFLVSKLRRLPPRTWTLRGHSLGCILLLAQQYAVYRMRRVASFSDRTNSWSCLWCSQTPALQKAAELNPGRYLFRVQPVGTRRMSSCVCKDPGKRA